MKRRSVLQSLIAIPAITGAAVTETPQQAVFNAETPTMPVVPPVETSPSIRRTFSPDQLFALEKLGDLIVPAYNGLPGASQAGAAAFLDFYIGASPKPLQDLYLRGLDTLNHLALTKFGQTFTNLHIDQAGTLLTPLSDPNSKDKLAPFLRTAKSDLLRATFNSRAYIDAVSQTRRPRNASKYFWYPIT